MFVQEISLTESWLPKGDGGKESAVESRLSRPLDAYNDGAYKDMCQYLGAGPKLPSAYIADNDIIALEQ